MPVCDACNWSMPMLDLAPTASDHDESDAFEEFGQRSDGELGLYRTRLRVLLIDDDEVGLDTFATALRQCGLFVATAASGRRGLELAARKEFDCVVVELRLKDMPGIDVIETLMREPSPASVIMTSACLSVESVVQATKLGAFDVLEKPFDAERLVASVRAAAGKRHQSRAAWMRWAVERRYGSVAERWSVYVLTGCNADRDPNTLDLWARENAVCYSTLCEVCRLNMIRPLAARDFVRVLRALRRAWIARCAPEEFLSVSDRRTLRSLSRRSGVDLDAKADASAIALFLERQEFVPTGEALRLVSAVVLGWVAA
jgi:DNA-binding response OmpR family regulator